MDTSFYAATRGAISYQERLNIISNNISNVNTYGYKSKNAAFLDLMHYNMHAPENADTRVKAGTGALVQRTDTNFDEAGFAATGGQLDYAINGEGFFMLRDPQTNAISYTRNGAFSVSDRGGTFYLVTDGRKLVLDTNGNPIQVNDGQLQGQIGTYTFVSFNGMNSVGNNEFVPVAKNGNPVPAGSQVVQGYLEQSNVDLADEMVKTVETSRAYSYILKMIQTSDEIEQTINGLRG